MTVKHIIYLETLVLVTLALVWLARGPAPENAVTSAVVAAEGVHQAPDLAAPAGRAGAGDLQRDHVASRSAQPVLLYGAVRDQHGRAVPARIEIEDGGEPLTRIYCDRDGAYSVFGLPSRRLRLQLSRFGYAARSLDLDLRGVGAEHRRDFQMQAGWVLEVHAQTPAGQPLVEALAASGMSNEGVETLAVVFGPADQPLRIPRVESVQARFARRRLQQPRRDQAEPQSLLSRVQLADPQPQRVALIFGAAILFEQVVAPGTARLDCSVRVREVLAGLGQVVGRVRGADPLPELKVVVGDRYLTTAVPGVDAVGRFRIDGAKPGVNGVYIFAKGHPRWFRRVDVPVGGVLDLGEIELPVAAELRVVVLDAEGRPAQALLAHRPLGPLRELSPRWGGWRREEALDVEGQAKLADVTVGSLLLRARSEDGRWMALARVELGKDGPSRHRMRLEDAVEVEVRLTTRLHAEPWLKVCTDEGLGVHAAFFAADEPLKLRLPKGRYRFEVWQDLERVTQRQVHVDRDQVVELSR